jgi:MFS family permease
MYVGRFVSGVGVGVSICSKNNLIYSLFLILVEILTLKQAASMLTPLYISENAPRAIRGGLTGIYQLFIATGVMLAFWVNYGFVMHHEKGSDSNLMVVEHP